MDGLDVSVLLHEPKRNSGIFRDLRRSTLHNPCRGILNGLYCFDSCLHIFLSLPSLELLE